VEWLFARGGPAAGGDEEPEDRAAVLEFAARVNREIGLGSEVKTARGDHHL